MAKITFKAHANGHNKFQHCWQSTREAMHYGTAGAMETDATCPNIVMSSKEVSAICWGYALAVTDQNKCWALLRRKFNRFYKLHTTTSNKSQQAAT